MLISPFICPISTTGSTMRITAVQLILYISDINMHIHWILLTYTIVPFSGWSYMLFECLTFQELLIFSRRNNQISWFIISVSWNDKWCIFFSSPTVWLKFSDADNLLLICKKWHQSSHHNLPYVVGLFNLNSLCLLICIIYWHRVK